MAVPITAVLALRFADGTVGRMQFYAEPTNENIEVAITKTKFKEGAVISWRRVNLAAFPSQHHELRGAWRDNDSSINVDMPIARNIWRDKMRSARAPLLQALDVEMTRAFRDPVKQDEIEAKRQALRDVTADPAIEAAVTPEQLKAVWPAALK